ncbi:single-stranded DNA-binding protein [Bacillus sp. 7894-2]|uniref:single-stranded DNA-binding protein n=1 Tax=Bacillus sp. 7894-2 TaxID=2021695 RepID=UPI000BA580B3|nr:single-stranded DNA-binding protein [Bacillus sp. 7894-2]PAE24024.1 hypothetical protein CHI10_14560 [Bacillus sp. 7894-2]
MGLRDRLKKREEQREKAASGGINAGLPEGVTRYVRLGQELANGKDFVILRDPNLWFFYYVHEDGDFATRATYVKKHTCLNSPRKAPDTEKEADEMFTKFAKPNPKVCISDKAKAKRVLYFMVPVYDVALETWRVLDLKEFHVNNLMDDMEKAEKAVRKFDKSYTMVGDIVTISKADKTYTIGSSDLDDEAKIDAIKAAAAKIDQTEIDYEELANFREESDIIEILREATEGKVDKSVLPAAEEEEDEAVDDSAEPIEDDMPEEDDLGF